MSLRPKPLAVATLAAVALIALACGYSEPAEATPTPSSTPTPEPFDPEATLKRSGQLMQGLRSFRFRLHHESGSLELLPGFRVDEVKGDVLNPDQISISLSGSYGTGFAIKASLITLGDDSYMTNPLTGKWEAVATGVSPLGFFNPGRGIAGMMLQVEGVRLLEEQGTTKGVYRLGGNLVAEALAPLVGKTSEGAMVQVELTIDADNLYLLKTRIIGQVTPTDTDRPVRVITISGFDEPVVIEAPL